MITRHASARYEGLGQPGKGFVSSESGVLDETHYGFTTRFGDEKGTNPEELVAAAHASCFTMALSFGLAAKGLKDGTLETKAAVTLEKDGDGFKVSKSALTLHGTVDGVSAEEFKAIAEDAKRNCPISKLLNAEVTLTIE